ncbi:MAG: ketopantoate reductase family protein [Blastococcus sp.]
MSSLRVAVLGPGGVGGLLAAVLSRAGADVVCLGGADTVAALTTSGIRVESTLLGSFTATVDAAEALTGPVDVLLVCVKATQLEAALERVPADVLGAALVVPLLNGVEHVEALRRAYPDAGVVAATIRVESTRTAPGAVRHDSPFVAVELAATGALAPRVRQLADVLEAAGVAARLRDDEQAVLWSKLNFLAPFALLTTSEQAPAGEVREHAREDLRALIGEVAAVARAEGAPADEEQVLSFFDGVPAAMRSSMQRDAEAGRAIEIDAIGGAIVRAAERHAVPVPVTARYVDELRARHPGRS